MSQMPHVVVVGGGFGGQNAHRELVRAGFRVTLVDRHPYSTFQPLLYQVATGGLNPGDIAYSLRRFAAADRHGTSGFRRATVTGLDLPGKRVFVSRGEPLAYDHLILAQGVGPNFFGVPGAREHALTIYTRAEALAVRDRIFSGLERLTVLPVGERQYTVLVVGGGATGVEMAGTLAELKSEAMPVVYPELSTDNFRVVLAELSPALLGPFAPKLQRYTLAELRKRGVDVRLGTAVRQVSADLVEFADGSRLDVDLVIWASGVAAQAGVASWGLPTGIGGRIVIDERCQVPGVGEVYAIGDCAVYPDRPTPQLAQPAIQMGAYVGRLLAARHAGGPEPAPFGYVDKGTMATIGRNAAVVQFPGGRTVTGVAAWALWVGVHMASLLGGRNRVQAMVNTAFRYFTWPQSATSIIGDVLPERLSDQGPEPGPVSGPGSAGEDRPAG